MSQPPIAKAADVFGRVNAYIGCVVFYVVGYIIVAASTSICEYPGSPVTGRVVH